MWNKQTNPPHAPNGTGKKSLDSGLQIITLCYLNILYYMSSCLM